MRDPIVFLAGDAGEAAAIQARLRQALEPGQDGSQVRAVVSILDLVPPDQPARLERLRRIRALVDDMAPFVGGRERERLDEFRRRLVDRPVTIDDVPASLRRRFLGRPGTPGSFVFVLHSVRLSDIAAARSLVEKARTVEAGGKTWHAASEAVVADDLVRVMFEDTMVAVPLSLLAALVVLWLDFRSARQVLVVVVPLVLGLGWMLAVLWLSGIRLSFYNMVVFPSIIGIGVDSGIHIYHRFLESPSARVDEVMSQIGGAVTISAATTVIGFGSMLLSVHRGLSALGLLAVIGLGCTLVAATVVFPMVLARGGRAVR